MLGSSGLKTSRFRAPSLRNESGWKLQRAVTVRSFPSGSDATITSRRLRTFLFGRTRNVVDAVPEVVSPDLEASSPAPLLRTVIRYETAFPSLSSRAEKTIRIL